MEEAIAKGTSIVVDRTGLDHEKIQIKFTVAIFNRRLERLNII